MIYENIVGIVGKTPLVKLNNYAKDIDANLIAKLDKMNPCGSSKDRIALAMIEDAEAKGLLKEGDTIVEPTSGNTGIGIAAIGRAKGYKVILTMPETMSIERQDMLRAYGAEIVLTNGPLGMQGAVDKAEELGKEIKGSFLPRQFSNNANLMAHYTTTGPEIWNDAEGQVDVFIAGVGTGGTVSGAGRYLKEQNKDIEIIAVEPATSPILSGGEAGPHKIQGIGPNFIPEVLDRDVIDRVMTVADEEAFSEAAILPRQEGLLCGISSGAVLAAAKKLGKMAEYKNKNIVVFLPDTGERYLSTPVFK